MALRKADAVALMAMLAGTIGVAAVGVQSMRAEQRAEEAAGFWMTIAAEDSMLQRLDLTTLRSTQDYDDSTYAEIHRLTEHYRVYHRGADSFLQVWVKP